MVFYIFVFPETKLYNFVVRLGRFSGTASSIPRLYLSIRARVTQPLAAESPVTQPLAAKSPVTQPLAAIIQVGGPPTQPL